MLKVYQCAKCKKVILSKEELKLEGWVELVAGSTDAAQEKHVPVVTEGNGEVKVNVGSVAHPMTAEHLIEWVALETEKGYQVAYLQANEAPMVAFKLADGDKAVAVYAYCNLHGLWKN
ncbi:MAG: desulfoferrodoxin [Clostridia bacterium]|nr:desulfoferrodoxin [Clostridia bacterium]